MSTVKGYSTMEKSELLAIRSQREEQLLESQHEIRKLKKKFKAGTHDRQVICEYIISAQSQIHSLIDSIEAINRSLGAELSAS